ncbi:MAG: enoyl-CoA hydratase/isomerase family protein [Deltaproteobacteria bacterium]|uniref:Enoyl-CoA hydratase/isomerase family protein n=1 Tax=Candidatus Zymogenus saltonus TaxID=2844893 RepID=A0A9D8KCR4_9DELT|nr:enoyl-CoA hydratase/isomerase family protein [Candidatus Zymogenus saltonus]
MAEKYKDIIYEYSAGVGIVTLNRQREMNALSKNLCQELSHLMEAARKDDAVKVLVFTGGSEVFSAGIDIEELVKLAPHEYQDHFEPLIDYYLDLYEFPKPMIAAVTGIAMGGGFNLALSCDFIIASDTSIFAHPEVKFGLNPIFDPLWRRVGIARAKEITMTGEPVGAREAERMGLVNRVLPSEEVMEAAMTLAKNIADKSPKVLSMIKRVSDLVPRLDRRSAIEHEVELSALLLSYEETRTKLNEALERLKRKKGK